MLKGKTTLHLQCQTFKGRRKQSQGKPSIPFAMSSKPKVGARFIQEAVNLYGWGCITWSSMYCEVQRYDEAWL
eukprot:6491894-Amphidinium_carterae.1